MGGSVFAVSTVILLAAQQAVGADAEELARRIKPGRSVFVTDTTGAERTGKVVEISAAGITLEQINGSRFTMPVESIARVQRTDSLWNGFLIGAAIVPTLFGIGTVVDPDSVSWTELHTVYTGLYAVLGIWCDWLRDGRTDLYRAGQQPAVSFAPMIGPRALGVGVRLSF